MLRTFHSFSSALYISLGYCPIPADWKVEQNWDLYIMSAALIEWIRVNRHSVHITSKESLNLVTYLIKFDLNAPQPLKREKKTVFSKANNHGSIHFLVPNFRLNTILNTFIDHGRFTSFNFDGKGNRLWDNCCIYLQPVWKFPSAW